MVQSKNAGLLAILIGSPLALLGLIFLLKGKVGVGLPFLMLGLAPAFSRFAAGPGPTSPAKATEAQPPAPVKDKELGAGTDS